MKDNKKKIDKEVLAGLIVIVVLACIALVLLIKREAGADRRTDRITKEAKQSEDTVTSGLGEEEIALANLQVISEENIRHREEEKIFPLYEILGSSWYQPMSLTERKQEDNQLKELYEYWDSYKLDAVGELIRLERLQKISEELKGTNKFYYYGSVDKLGRPSGKGLAVYEDNTYYFGEWKEGLRHGKGMWLEAAIYTEENQDKNLGLIEHSYSGEWSRDLPNGEGQEHFSYDYSVLREDNIKRNECMANVIGSFKDGYYHGEMYLMTIEGQGKLKEWTAICNYGVWEPFMTGNTTDAVFESYEKDENQEAEYHYMYPEDNKNFGIMGLKK